MIPMQRHLYSLTLWMQLAAQYLSVEQLESMVEHYHAHAARGTLPRPPVETERPRPRRRHLGDRA